MFNFDDLFSHKIMNKKLRGDRVDKKYMIGGVCIGVILVAILLMVGSDQSTSSGTQLKIDYSGSWSGAYSDDSGTQSIEGTGPKTLNISSEEVYVSADAQKQAGNSKVMTLSIIKNGKVVANKSTSAAYGVVAVDA